MNERGQMAVGMLGGFAAAFPLLWATAQAEGRTAGEAWLFAIGAALGLAVAAACWRRVPSGRRIAAAAAAIVFGALAGGSALNYLNRLHETRPVESFRSRVVGRQTSVSRGGRATYTVLFGPVPWSGSAQPIADRTLYDEVRLDDPICGELHSGVLGWR